MINTKRCVIGFTLIELMMAMTISTIIISGVYTAFKSQQRTQIREQLVVEMNQNIRAAMVLIKKEIRQAGLDPTNIWGIDGKDNDNDFDIDESDERENDRSLDGIDNDNCFDYGSGADTVRNRKTLMDEKIGIKIAGPHLIRFNMDLTGDRDICDPNEEVAFGFSKGNDSNQDGIADMKVGGVAPLGRATGRGYLQPLVSNIQALAFAYAFDFDHGTPVSELDGNLDTAPGNTIIWAFDFNHDGFLDTVLDTNEDGRIDNMDDPGGAAMNERVPIDRIRAVRIWLLARTGAPIRQYNDKKTYVVGDIHIEVDDQYRRSLFETIIKCRNLQYKE